ncbi:metal ABC transporter substrate-binding protein [Lysinibacillus sphaericus]|uniref:ABC transporter substrate-binding protein n=1 Tax=Lysinibacillus sphaericus TaxID=1421 RepID=UPI0018CF10AA|nr:cobalamin-binding protein [Lysinibacillus sphaericus]MBG9455506.1 metal ABC transporter substrate-binding protein [Lysinibacillus sphaericus]MBG9477923.1 metal ABC transporter substrate-binding protein [Lysinibacillus sphaericus]MBG9594063.1 metal ABC transporter substrate-binding protein [Lysinibacillus sphaericus]
MKKMFKLQWLSVLMLVLVLVGCGTKEDTKKDAVSKEDQQVEKTSYKVKDDRGVEVEFNAVPKTIVSLQPSNTEILFALGVGDKIVGATEYDSYPEEAQKIERVSDSTKFNSERILALKPDVVIAYTTGGDEENLNALKGLEDAGIKVFAIQSAKSFDDVYGDIEQVATVMGIKDKGDKLNKDIKAKIADVQAKVKDVKKPKNIYLEISPKPNIYTAGSDTFQQEILNAANVNNVFGDLKSWPKVSEEDIIVKNPEVILTTVGYVKNSPEEILSRDGWNSITAIQNKAVYYIDTDISNRPGPRIGEAVELVAKAVYPELFK